MVVYGREYFFGGGIQTGRPGRTQYGNPIKTVPLGRTEVPLELVEDFLNEIKDRYSVYVSLFSEILAITSGGPPVGSSSLVLY